jgi:tetratricopeptide (TPR) repeat protein
MKRLLLVLAVVGCGHREQPAAPPLTAPTQEEADAFAKKFAKHVIPCDRSALNRDIDGDQMITRALAGRKMQPEKARGARMGITTHLSTAMCDIASPTNVLGGEAPSYEVLRTRMIDGHPRPLLRLASDAGVTYHELTLDKQHGEVRVADILLYSTGETFSEMVGSMLDALDNPSDGLGMSRAKQLLNEGKAKEARDAVDTLPDRLRNTKTVMLFRVFASGAMNDDAEYLKTMDEFAKAYPNDPALELVQIDQAFLKKDYKKVLEMLDRLDKRVGGDPYLELQRAAVYIELKDIPNALKHAKLGTEKAPELQQVWWARANAEVAAKEYAASLKTLEHLRSKFGAELDPQAMREDARFTALVDSPEFAAWLKKQK